MYVSRKTLRHSPCIFFYFFPFQVRTEDPDLPEENQASKDYRAIAYSSLSQSYLYIDWTENYKPLLVGEHLNIVVTPRSPYIDKITHYNYLVSIIMKDLYLSIPPPDFPLLIEKR